MKREVAGVPVYYEERGSGRPVVMLPGWSLDHTSVALVTEPLFEERPGWRRIYVDLPGTGQTPGADWIMGSDQVLQLLLKFLDEVIPEERFVVVGISYGAYLARGLVQRRGSTMDGLLLSVPVIHADGTKRTVPSRTVLVRDETFVKSAREGGHGWIEELGVVLDSSVDTFVKTFNPNPARDDAFLEKVRKRYAFSFDVDRLEKPFPAPALFLLGRQDHVVGYHDAWSILENYPRATLAVMDRAGHLLNGEQSGLASALITDWLNRVDEWTRQREDGGTR
jgi:pimeloyl-ACP methyl ester carboxylesterase